MKTIKRIGSVFLLLAAMLWMTACSDMTDGKTFYERAMEKIPLPKGCSEWKYLPNDYDGDGKIEVFAFGGEENNENSSPAWTNIQFYYIDSQGTVKKMNFDQYFCGAPIGTETFNQREFKDAYLTVGKQTYVRIYGGRESCGYELIYSVYGGKPTESSVDGGIDAVTKDGYVIGSSESEFSDIYVSKNGRLEFVKSIYTGN